MSLTELMIKDLVPQIGYQAKLLKAKNTEITLNDLNDVSVVMYDKNQTNKVIVSE